MNKAEILSSLDAEIQRLQQVRELLSDESAGGKNANASKNAVRKASGTRMLRRKRRRMSAEARAKIAAAHKKRWAALKRLRKK
jgi:hypothetical protein